MARPRPYIDVPPLRRGQRPALLLTWGPGRVTARRARMEGLRVACAIEERLGDAAHEVTEVCVVCDDPEPTPRERWESEVSIVVDNECSEERRMALHLLLLEVKGQFETPAAAQPAAAPATPPLSIAPTGERGARIAAWLDGKYAGGYPLSRDCLLHLVDAAVTGLAPALAASAPGRTAVQRAEAAVLEAVVLARRAGEQLAVALESLAQRAPPPTAPAHVTEEGDRAVLLSILRVLTDPQPVPADGDVPELVFESACKIARKLRRAEDELAEIRLVANAALAQERDGEDAAAFVVERTLRRGPTAKLEAVSNWMARHPDLAAFAGDLYPMLAVEPVEALTVPQLTTLALLRLQLAALVRRGAEEALFDVERALDFALSMSPAAIEDELTERATRKANNLADAVAHAVLDLRWQLQAAQYARNAAGALALKLPLEVRRPSVDEMIAWLRDHFSYFRPDGSESEADQHVAFCMLQTLRPGDRIERGYGVMLVAAIEHFTGVQLSTFDWRKRVAEAERLLSEAPRCPSLWRHYGADDLSGIQCEKPVGHADERHQSDRVYWTDEELRKRGLPAAR